MSLHYLVKLEMLVTHVLPWSCGGRISRIYPTSIVASKFTKLESSWLQRRGLLQEKVYETRIISLDERNSDWDGVVQVGSCVIAAAIR